jgi:hypothetical protein
LTTLKGNFHFQTLCIATSGAECRNSVEPEAIGEARYVKPKEEREREIEREREREKERERE